MSAVGSQGNAAINNAIYTRRVRAAQLHNTGWDSYSAATDTVSRYWLSMMVHTDHAPDDDITPAIPRDQAVDS